MSRKCPICKKGTMKKAGQIKAGQRGGLRNIFQCKICGYRSA